MATTDDGDTPEENEDVPRDQMPLWPNESVDDVVMQQLPPAARGFATRVLQERRRRQPDGNPPQPPQQQVVQSADQVHNVFIGGADAYGAGIQANQVSSLAVQRQKFHFDFLKHALKQAEWTFRLSVYFMTGGAAVILVGAVLALVHAGSPNHGYVPLVTGLTGVLITTGGGALALHSKRAMANLTKAAERIEDKIDADHQLETATTFIDRVQDKDAKDRLNAAAAMKALNMQANQTMVNRLLPGDQPKEIEPGDSTTN
ncbi:TRADD-N-associated membrane domain-containing protein [Streptomyces sp. 900105755]